MSKCSECPVLHLAGFTKRSFIRNPFCLRWNNRPKVALNQGQVVSSTSKGNRLEDAFHRYLLDQKERGELVDGVHSPALCEIFKKKKYHCSDRDGDVEFDIVLEITRPGANTPYQWIVFECKNYRGNVPEEKVNHLSKKLTSVFGHAAKGVMVVSSRLQLGAEKVARKYHIGIVKFDETGAEIVAERNGGLRLEKQFVVSQIFQNAGSAKSLKLAAYHDGRFFDVFNKFLGSFVPWQSPVSDQGQDTGSAAVPFIHIEDIRRSAEELLERIDYQGGPVNLERACAELSIDLHFTKRVILNSEGKAVLGSANFSSNLILINDHENGNRERFTLGHEIGHFRLNHGRYLRSESVIESDLLIQRESGRTLNYERLEYQANAFSSALILPELHFRVKIAEYRRIHDIRNRVHGFIFVDDQIQNLNEYHDLLGSLSTHFEVSKHVIEIRFKDLNMLTDQRKGHKATPGMNVLNHFPKFGRR